MYTACLNDYRLVSRIRQIIWGTDSILILLNSSAWHTPTHTSYLAWVVWLETRKRLPQCLTFVFLFHECTVRLHQCWRLLSSAQGHVSEQLSSRSLGKVLALGAVLTVSHRQNETSRQTRLLGGVFASVQLAIVSVPLNRLAAFGVGGRVDHTSILTSS